ANIRYDGTSRYRGPLRWNLYPSVSLGWNIAEEAFMEPYKRNVGTLKIRGSYGELGNQNTDGWYPTYLTFSPVVNGGAWLQNGQKTTVIGVPAAISTSLTWEKVRNWNVGLDWALFDNRFFGSFDYYTRYTLNMIGASVELPSILGYTPPKTNNTDLKTYGWELEIAWQDHRSNGFEYGIKFLLSDAQTMITRYPSNTTGSIDQYLAGEKLGNIWGYETVGIARSQEEMNAHLDLLDENFYNHNGYYPSEPRMGQSALGSGWGAGDIMYADLDGDGRISAGERTMHDHGDLKILGNNTPRYQFGIDLNAAWYGVDLRIFFQGVMKRGYWQGSSYFWGANTDAWWSAALVQHLDFYRDENSLRVQRGIMEANTDAYYPRPSFDNGGGRGRNHQPQSRYLQNAAYIRLKNLQIGYTLPDKWMQKIHVQKLRIYFSAENLFTATKLATMFDPETIDGGNNNSEKDWRTRNNGNAYPLSQEYSFGLSITL
ncbi:MAG TPA: SusC/RagA family protein, partial [Bacteroidales bacterium]|nr:SusC/RagA family protein [Bacteroidales bacterium]